ncbi:hypothetical protein HPB50_001440 [Hyalomma asiaticum]|uniref:Uncharacterized protein n=1 Tax=Hyalomma asiaticum TaxID=266040 RepID=A0ACB7TB99_HYAAI|nr:hypothetical protein HPB50_001440 [Hyalomma asiaticum]
MAVRKRGDAKKSAAEAAASSNGTQRAAPAVPVFSARRIVVRVGVSVALLVALYVPAWWKSASVRTFASADEVLAIKSETVGCSKDYVNDRRLFKDNVERNPESNTIMDSSSAKFGSDVGRLLEQKGTTLFSDHDLKVYKQVKDKIRSLISFQFGIRPDALHLTHPTFFSEMTVRPAVTVHDEYWHVHVDKEQYGSFHYTSLLYLTDYNADFGGGRLVFVDGSRGNATVEPKKGRVLAFTSGSENPHYVEKVNKGVRYALTVSFSCDPSKAIRDPGRTQPSV